VRKGRGSKEQKSCLHLQKTSDPISVIPLPLVFTFTSKSKNQSSTEMNIPAPSLKGCVSVSTVCIALVIFSSVTNAVPTNGFDLTGSHSLVFQNRMGKRNSLSSDDIAVEENNLGGLDVHKISSNSEGIDKRESFEVPMDTNNNERIKRSSHSGYVRFGKRFSPLIEGLQGHHNIDSLEPMNYDDENAHMDSREAIGQRQQRAPESSYVRFGKRAPEGLTYSGCVAYTLARATNRSDLLRMLVQNGCVKNKRLLHYAKKDGYIRFGK